jgi:ABC-type cobalamin/Fe3+-siderophores transport system ATPase subunit
LKDGVIQYDGTPSAALSPDTIADIYGVRAVFKNDDNNLPYIIPRRVRNQLNSDGSAL